jgi:hypothetical protein
MKAERVHIGQPIFCNICLLNLSFWTFLDLVLDRCNRLSDPVMTSGSRMLVTFQSSPRQIGYKTIQRVLWTELNIQGTLEFWSKYITPSWWSLWIPLRAIQFIPCDIPFPPLLSISFLSFISNSSFTFSYFLLCLCLIHKRKSDLEDEFELDALGSLSSKAHGNGHDSESKPPRSAEDKSTEKKSKSKICKA